MFATRTLRLLIALFVAVTLVPTVAAQQPQDGVLLMKHGTTLSGFITPAGDRYIVLLGESGEARVPVADVAVVVRNLQEAYQYKRGQLDDRLSSRIELAQWCLQQDLLARAADQLLASERLFGSQPQLESLHRRLIAMANQKPPSTSPVEEKAKVANVSFDEELHTFPSNSVDFFTSTVQPLLLNRCASGGCHNMRGTSDFILFRPFAGQSATQRLTERNLNVTLAYVDRTDPLKSLLLSKASAAHGGATTAAIELREQKQLDVVAAWVRSLAKRRPVSNPNTINPANELLYQPARSRPSHTDESARARSTSRPEKPSVAPEEKREGDPFDPAVFNQRHHGRTK